MSDPRTETASTADLLKQASDQTVTLVKQELELAKVELSEKGKQAGVGIGLFGGAGVFGLYGVAALIVTLIALLALVVDLWLAALIVAVVLFVVAAVLGVTGKGKVQQATPPAPEAAIATTQADVQDVKAAAQRGRTST